MDFMWDLLVCLVFVFLISASIMDQIRSDLVPFVAQDKGTVIIIIF